MGGLGLKKSAQAISSANHAFSVASNIIISYQQALVTFFYSFLEKRETFGKFSLQREKIFFHGNAMLIIGIFILLSRESDEALYELA